MKSRSENEKDAICQITNDLPHQNYDAITG